MNRAGACSRFPVGWGHKRGSPHRPQLEPFDNRDSQRHEREIELSVVPNYRNRQVLLFLPGLMAVVSQRAETRLIRSIASMMLAGEFA
jgi:hypothetical protein